MAQAFTQAEARGAIYFDFEGNIDRPPTIIGYAYEADGDLCFGQVIVELEMHKARKASVSGTCLPGRARSESLASVMSMLLERARCEDRRLVSWSEHDLQKLLEAGLSGADETAIVSAHVNALHVAKRWLRWRDGQAFKTGENTLANYCTTIGFDIPEEYGPGISGEAIRLVRDHLSRHKSWNMMPYGVQNKWLRMLCHNYYDVMGMRQVLLTATAELETEEAV